MKTKMPFRTPKEIGKREDTEPVSTRIRVSAAQILKDAASKEGESLSWLVGRVLEDYAEWLKAKKP